MSYLNAPHLHDEAAAFRFVEARVWAKGRVCPHCGVVDQSSAMKGASTRMGTYKCYACRKPFTVKIGTIFESSHVKMHLWLQAIFLIASSKKGISTNQLHRTLGVTLKTAWFMSHRIREAMRSDNKGGLLGGGGSIVEGDETYFGKPAEGNKTTAHGNAYKTARRKGARPIVSLVERAGQVRSFHVPSCTKANVSKIIMENVDRESRFMTDESRLYTGSEEAFLSHETTKHSAGEYARGDVYSNTVEAYFSVFKRGMRGTYQHCAEKHLHRYLAEFDFRFNNRVALGVDDSPRTDELVRSVVGKRLTYQTASARA